MIVHRTVSRGFLRAWHFNQCRSHHREHADPPVKPLQHALCACGDEVARDCRMTSLHYPRAHEQWHIIRMGSSFNKQTARPADLGASSGGGDGG